MLISISAFRKVYCHMRPEHVGAAEKGMQFPPSTRKLTDYDLAHFSTYMQLLTLASDGASIEEMANSVFGLTPTEDANRSRGIVEAHLKRANWMLTSGYKQLMPA